MPNKKPPTFTITADDEAFEKIVATYHGCVQTRMELSNDERARATEEMNDLLKAARAYQKEHGIGKPRADMARRWETVAHEVVE